MPAPRASSSRSSSTGSGPSCCFTARSKGSSPSHTLLPATMPARCLRSSCGRLAPGSDTGDRLSYPLPGVSARAATGRTVVAHLGNGASLCAMKGGQSVASTMSFTTVDGLPMGTRCGALDPGVLLYLMDRHGMDARALETLLYQQSGLLGVSGISSDMRTLLGNPEPRAAEALDLFVYRI